MSVSVIFEQAISQGASDIHLGSGRVPYLRIKGDLVPMQSIPVYDDAAILRDLVFFVGEERARKVINQEEVDFSYQYEDKARVRGHAYISSGKVNITLRLITKIKTVQELGLPDALVEFARAEQGFFLVVGPVGQGKSTTMAALVDLINTERAEHIVTIEHPIEYKFENKLSLVDQRAVGIDTKSFSAGLRAALRQDVNVILIGEMRDSETVETAVTAAETGHLVFSTLHTNSASQTIDRIIDSFPAARQSQIRSQLSTSLLGIFSQRLLNSIQGGRVLAYELLINNDAISNLIREGRVHEIDSIIDTQSSVGMVSMNRSLLELMRAGHITFDQAAQHSLDPDGLQRMIA